MTTAALARTLRIAVAAGLTLFVLWHSDPAAVVDAARDAHPGFIALACTLVLLDRGIMAHRWLALLSPLAAARRLPLWTVMRVFFVSTFLGTFLPASIGGDALRAYGLSREGVSGADTVASILMDRLLGIVSILIVAVAGTLLAHQLVDVRVLLPGMAVLAAACLASAAVVFSARTARLIERVLSSAPVGRDRGRRLLAAVQRYARRRRLLAAVLASSIAVQVLRVLQTYCLGLALGLAVPLSAYFALVPLILLIVLLPVTINGLGTTQAGFVWLFAGVGVAAPAAFTLSVLFLAIAVVGNLPGAVLYMTGGAWDRRVSAADSSGRSTPDGVA
jgi:glycosyltransferase 2 family protein